MVSIVSNTIQLYKKIFYYLIEYIKSFNSFSLNFLYNSRYLIVTICLFIITYSIVKKNIYFILLGFTILLFTIIIWIDEFIIIEKWKDILKPIISEIPERNECELYSVNKLYRLGDMVMTKLRWLKEGEKYHFNVFPNSIATEYMKKSKTQKNYKLLANIVQERTRKTNDLPKNKDLVVHLRVGDTIEENSNSLITILSSYTYMDNSRASSNYTCPIRNIQEKLDKLKNNEIEIEKIILVAGSHVDIITPKSCKYIDVMKKYLEIKGYNVELRLGKNPDDDFIFMCNSKYFIQSCGGNYTNLIKNIVTIIGGKVL